MRSTLPAELIVEILWISHPLDVLNAQLVCKRFKSLIDSSTKLQLLIEWYRDDRSPASHSAMGYETPQRDSGMLEELISRSSSLGTAQQSNLESHVRATTSPFTTEVSKRATQSCDQILRCQLRKRRLWQRFSLQFSHICSARWDEWTAYEVHNGYLGYYSKENGRHKILFNCLDSNGSRESRDAAGSFVGSSDRTGIDGSVGYKGDGIAVEETMSQAERSGRLGYEVSRTSEVTLPACPMAFTFDISQDLLVMLDGPDEVEPCTMRILCASTGRPHPIASTPVINDPLRVGQSLLYLDANLVLKDSVIGISKAYEDAGMLRVAVIEWKTGKHIFCQNVIGGTEFMLISPTELAVLIKCGILSEMEILIVNLGQLERPSEDGIQPLSEPALRTMIFSLPKFMSELDPPASLRTSFDGAEFVTGSFSASSEIHQSSQREKETDVLPILLSTISSNQANRMSDGPDEDDEPSRYFLLFISRRHLLQAFEEHRDDNVWGRPWEEVFNSRSMGRRRLKNTLNAFKKSKLYTSIYELFKSLSGEDFEEARREDNTEADAGSELDVSNPLFLTKGVIVPNPVELDVLTAAKAIPFEEWGSKGTRWLNAGNVFLFTQSTSCGSQFLCVGHPRELGFDFRMPEGDNLGECGGTEGQDNVDPANANEEADEITLGNAFVCLLDFNYRLWRNIDESAGPILFPDPSTTHIGQELVTEIPPRGTEIIRTNNNVDPILSSLKVDVKGGMPYRLSYCKLPAAVSWRSLLINREHLVAATNQGMEIYNLEGDEDSDIVFTYAHDLHPDPTT